MSISYFVSSVKNKTFVSQAIKQSLYECVMMLFVFGLLVSGVPHSDIFMLLAVKFAIGAMILYWVRLSGSSRLLSVLSVLGAFFGSLWLTASPDMTGTSGYVGLVALVLSGFLLRDISLSRYLYEIQRDGGIRLLAVSMVAIPLITGFAMVGIGYLSDINMSWGFAVIGLLYILLLPSALAEELPPIHRVRIGKTDAEAVALCLLAGWMNAFGLIVTRALMPAYIATLVARLDLGDHAFKILGIITGGVLLFGILSQRVRSLSGRFFANSYHLMVFGAVMIGFTSILWSVAHYALVSRGDALEVVGYISVMVVIIMNSLLGKLWSIGFFDQLNAVSDAYSGMARQMHAIRNNLLFGVMKNALAPISFFVCALLLIDESVDYTYLFAACGAMQILGVGAYHIWRKRRSIGEYVGGDNDVGAPVAENGG